MPGIAEDGSRAEAFLSLTENEPCLVCFDGYRPVDSPVRRAALLSPDGFPAVHLAFSLALAVLDSDSREAEALLTPLRRGGPVPQLFRAWPPGAAELAHADDGRTEVPWRADCPGCGGSSARASASETAPSLSQLEVPPLERINPEHVWWLYGIELLALIASPASASAVFAAMWASVALGLGIWLGYRWREQV